MKSDSYTRFVLTVIAVCLVLLTLKTFVGEPVVNAAADTTCTGELTAKAFGGIKETIGGYHLTVRCD